MANNKIRVNTDLLKRTQESINAKLNNIKDDLKVITEQMAVLNSSWTGEAHDTFVREIDSDIVLLQNVCENIQSVINYEGNAITEYNRCEEQISSIIAQIQI